MMLSIIIPVYNDRDFVERAIQQVKAVDYGIPYEIVVIDDGSTDGSREILKTISDIHLVLHQVNLGKGAAVRTGLQHCTGDVIAIQDDDCEYDPEVVPSLIDPIVRGDSDVVYGSRFLKKNLMYFVQKMQNIAITTLANILLGQRLTDIETGHKMFSRKVAEKLELKESGFEFDMEITLQILRLRYRIKELPTNYSARSHHEGKKITYVDGIKTIRTLFKYKFGSKRKGL